MSAELMIFAWSLALAAALTAGLLLSSIEWVARGVRAARDARASARRSAERARPVHHSARRPTRPLGRLVRGWLTALR
jgi:hypothetical protein